MRQPLLYYIGRRVAYVYEHYNVTKPQEETLGGSSASWSTSYRGLAILLAACTAPHVQGGSDSEMIIFCIDRNTPHIQGKRKLSISSNSQISRSRLRDLIS